MLALVLPVFILGGCAHPALMRKSESVTYHAFIPSGAIGFNLHSNQSITLGAGIKQAPPNYPAQLDATSIPKQSVCLAIAINEKGVVYMSHPLFGIAGCPVNEHAIEPAFVVAAQHAVTHWLFVPSLLCTFQRGTSANAPGNHCPMAGVVVTPVAISLAFVFTFTQANGLPAVYIRSLGPVR